jgi:hypothetical protein
MTTQLPFAAHHAVVIGINAYRSVEKLRTAVADAARLAALLETQHGFTVHPPLLDATGEDLRHLLHEVLPSVVGANDRLLFYFAGHGTAEDGDNGPADGYLVPADANPADPASMIAMRELRAALEALPCRHLLLILDCCFSGAFAWGAQQRAVGSLTPKRLYQQRFDRFVRDPAWQVITSAAADQQALDVIQGRATGRREEDGADHSPFALALFAGIAGDADGQGNLSGDGVITAQKLYTYLRDQVETASIAVSAKLRQTPGYFTLPKHDKGEFIFLKPGHRLNLPPIPDRSPYMGLESFDENDQLLFFGRGEAIAELRALAATKKLLVVSGASGTGKSSVVKAGLLPLLRAEGHAILPVMRPGEAPLAALDSATAALADAESTAVLVIDQCEELITRCANRNSELQAFPARIAALLEDPRIHRIIITVRSDFEPRLVTDTLRAAWLEGRYTVLPLKPEELRSVIAMPAIQEVLLFEPSELVNKIADEVVQSPGALPLLSYTLDALYHACLARDGGDRTLKEKPDYERLGGVMGALSTKADALHDALPPDEQAIMRKVVLRMVSLEGGIASRRVDLTDLDFGPAESTTVQHVVNALVDARLVVQSDGHIEPAHDALVRAWSRLYEWIHAAGTDTLLLLRQLNAAAREYAVKKTPDYLWHDNPKLAEVERLIAKGGHLFNAAEYAFVAESLARRKRNARRWWASAAAVMVVLAGLAVGALIEARQADAEKQLAIEETGRAIFTLVSSLSLDMKTGRPGSICANTLCPGAPAGDGGAWFSASDVPDELRFVPPEERRPAQTAKPYRWDLDKKETSRDFVVARRFGDGHVMAYAQDSLGKDVELVRSSESVTFIDNAVRWLYRPNNAVLDECPGDTWTVLLWEGTFAKLKDFNGVRQSGDKHGWTLRPTSHATLTEDLKCASVLWYISDWEPPRDFASQDVPIIETFVRNGGGLLVGGLGWSFWEKGPWSGPDLLERPGEGYAANVLGERFGFAFTHDKFEPKPTNPAK